MPVAMEIFNYAELCRYLFLLCVVQRSREIENEPSWKSWIKLLRSQNPGGRVGTNLFSSIRIIDVDG